jgi:MYXO-CTERM domain-containing protein
MRQVPNCRLWIGTGRDARDLGKVLDAGVEAVVDVAVEEPPAVLTRDLVYLRFPLVDGGGNPPWLLAAAGAAVAGLIRQRVPTLVACGAGLSRGPAVAALGFCLASGWDADAVLREVQDRAASDVHPALWDDVLACLAAGR